MSSCHHRSTSIHVLVLSFALESHGHLAMNKMQLKIHFLGFWMILKLFKDMINCKECVLHFMRCVKLLATLFAWPKSFGTVAWLLYLTVALYPTRYCWAEELGGICLCPHQKAPLLAKICWWRVHQASLH